MTQAERLLDWMTHCHLPLQLWREDDDLGIGEWVVVDASTGEAIGHGADALDALEYAYACTVLA